jgi:hypothetical protein
MIIRELAELAQIHGPNPRPKMRNESTNWQQWARRCEKGIKCWVKCQTDRLYDFFILELPLAEMSTVVS